MFPFFPSELVQRRVQRTLGRLLADEGRLKRHGSDASLTRSVEVTAHRSRSPNAARETARLPMRRVNAFSQTPIASLGSEAVHFKPPRQSARFFLDTTPTARALGSRSSSSRRRPSLPAFSDRSRPTRSSASQLARLPAGGDSDLIPDRCRSTRRCFPAPTPNRRPQVASIPTLYTIVTTEAVGSIASLLPRLSKCGRR